MRILNPGAAPIFTHLTTQFPKLFFCVLAAACGLSATASKSGEPETAAPAAADLMLGKEPGQVRDDNGLKMKLVWCPQGEFTMGSPKAEKGRINSEDQVHVTLTNGFWLGKYEVTQSEWKHLMQTEPWKGEDEIKEGVDFPATFVSWDDASDFCRKLTEREGEVGRLPKDWEYTLPTEALWERACRARAETSFCFGDDESKLGDWAWFRDNTAGRQFAHRVGQKKANQWGFCDMHGNVWEWCRDIYTEKLPGGRDPEVKPDDKRGASNRVYRGGSWGNYAAFCRSAYRYGDQPNLRSIDTGFRTALSAVRRAH